MSVRGPGVESPFFPGGAAMRPDDGAVDHLQHVQFTATVRQSLQQDVPDTGEAPAAELPPHRIPVAKCLRKIAPGCTGAANPEDTIQRPAMVVRRTSATRRSGCQEWFNDCPFLVRHQTSDHCRPPSREAGLESHRSASGESAVEKRNHRNPPRFGRFFSQTLAVGFDSFIARECRGRRTRRWRDG